MALEVETRHPPRPSALACQTTAMSGRFVLSRTAARDLDEILSFVLANSGPKRAEHVANHLYRAFQESASASFGGTPDLPNRLRKRSNSLPPCTKPSIAGQAFSGTPSMSRTSQCSLDSPTSRPMTQRTSGWQGGSRRISSRWTSG